MENPLLLTLQITQMMVNSGQCSAEFLSTYLGISDRTLKRHIASARHLGADIRPFRAGRHWIYECVNRDDIKKLGRLQRWIELEESRTLV